MGPGQKFSKPNPFSSPWQVARGGSVRFPTAGLIDHWKATGPFYTHLTKATEPTATGNSVLRWIGGVNGVPMKNTIGSFIPTFQKDVLGAGNSALRLSSALICSDAVASFNQRGSTVIAVAKQTDTTKPGLVSLCTTGGDFSTGAFWLNSGYARPSIESFNVRSQSNIGGPINEYVMIAVVADNAGYFYWINGRKSDVYADPVSSIAYTGVGLGVIPGIFSGYDVAELLVYNRAISDDEYGIIFADAASRLGISTPATACNLVFRGNSITSGAMAVYYPYAASAAVAAGVSAYDYRNYGYSGAHTETLSGLDATFAPTQYNAALAANRNIAFLWEITNYLGASSSATAATALSQHAAWVTIWRNAGFKVCTATILDRTGFFGGGQNSAGFAAAQATVNAALLTNAGGIYGDFVCDLTSVASAGSAGDGVHPTQAGHTSIGALVGVTIAAAMA